MTGPTVPERYKAVESAPVRIGRHVVIGAGSVVLPGCDVGDGAAVGALSLVNRSLPAWMIYAGSPARGIRPRERDLLALEDDYRASEHE
jgi:galactoside O-acetyltransferase